ncbi:O-antigen polymerase [Aureimonas sp. SA4125]|uniref:O-antigen ligase family protein n=1 Tax=Aureimonas sp. SA4125 TaxID=2826993 RepID=UPI001CC4D3EC|nr:O-antigen ligase [Aureimonas sp. SA4125]BDA82759.1 O-antigen polymerase [Aureimonas sp. SA4125]
MNSIAAPNRTDLSPQQQAVQAVQSGIAAAILVALLVSFTPFVAESDSTASSGNLVNQIGFGGLGLLALVSHALFSNQRVVFALLRPTWLVMAGWMVFSVTQSATPDAALRAVAFSLLAMVAATAVVCLPPNERAFRLVLTMAALTVLGLSYVGVVLLPDVAIHGAGGDEPQHAGLWRGIYAHKNIAGPIMAALFFAGVYLIRSGDRGWGWLIAVLAGVFVYATGSKTSAALVPIVAFLVVGSRIFGGRVLPILILSIAIVSMALMTIGTVLSPFLDGILQAILPGTTFTGRMDLWRFALDQMQAQQWTGWGFESFWLSEHITSAEVPFELSWDPRGIVNSHSGYLDIAIALGWPALLPASLLLVILPFKDYLNCRPSPENGRLADFFLMVLAFCLLNSFLESYLFKRADPVWMVTWIAIVGLRLLAKFRIAP